MIIKRPLHAPVTDAAEDAREWLKSRDTRYDVVHTANSKMASARKANAS